MKKSTPKTHDSNRCSTHLKFKTQQKSFAAPKGRVETLTSFKHVKTEAVSRLTEDSRKDVSNLAFTVNPFKLTSDIEKKAE